MLKRSDTDDRTSLLHELRRAQDQLPPQLAGAQPDPAAQHDASSSSLPSTPGTGRGSHRVVLRIPSCSQRPISHELRSVHSHKLFTRAQQREKAMLRKQALRERKLEVDRLLQHLLGGAREGVLAHALELAESSGSLKSVASPRLSSAPSTPQQLRLSSAPSAPQLRHYFGGPLLRHSQERSSHRSLENLHASRSLAPISGILSTDEVDKRAKSVLEGIPTIVEREREANRRVVPKTKGARVLVGSRLLASGREERRSCMLAPAEMTGCTAAAASEIAEAGGGGVGGRSAGGRSPSPSISRRSLTSTQRARTASPLVVHRMLDQTALFSSRLDDLRKQLDEGLEPEQEEAYWPPRFSQGRRGDVGTSGVVSASRTASPSGVGLRRKLSLAAGARRGQGASRGGLDEIIGQCHLLAADDSRKRGPSACNSHSLGRLSLGA